jgi:hypothetical protein
LLERYSEALEGVPVRALAGELAGRGPDLESACRALAASTVGMFAITSVAAGDGVWVRDLVGLGEYPLEEAEGSLALQPGDLLVGRITPVGDTLYRVSPCAGVFRAPGLLAALESDLQRARAGHRGTLRLSQRELEAMFFAAEPTLHAGADLQAQRRLAHERACAGLRAAGLDEANARRLVDALATRPYDGRPLVLGTPGDGLGDLLDQVAFDTDADLDACRRALLLAWPLLAEERPPAVPLERRASAAAALASFDRGRQAGRDLDELFVELERDLELDESGGLDEPEPAADEPVPDFPGVVGAMVDEFLWELGREQGPEAVARCKGLADFARFGAAYGVFENLRAHDLVLFLSVWLPEHGELATAAEAHAAVDALRAFSAWAEEWHGVPLASGLGTRWSAIREDLGRLVPLNARLAERPAGAGPVQLVEYLGAGRVRDAQGTLSELAPDRETLQALRPGDRLRVVGGADGGLCTLRCYLPQSAELRLAAR